MKIKHNCCKQNNFEWKEVNPVENYKDIIKCKTCGRVFREKEASE